MRLVEFVVGAAVLVFMAIAILGATMPSAFTHLLTLPGLPIRINYRLVIAAYTTMFTAAFIVVGIVALIRYVLALIWYVLALIYEG